MSIEIEFDNHHNKYRIDIRDRYEIHNFWLFDENKWLYIENYVIKLVKNQYKSLVKKQNIINISSDAYYNSEPKKMYNYIKNKIRKDKLKRILK